MFTFTDVSFQRTDRTILKHINWEVKPQENWAILGLNGSGKTTLLQLLNGYLWPSQGKLNVLGHEFGKTSIPELRKSIGWVSSALSQQMKEYEDAEMIVLSGKFASIGIHQLYSEEELQEAKDMLTACGGEKLIGKRFEVLSQGERQLVLIARAMMAKPELLILDEPCNGLDLFARERLLQQVKLIAESEDHPTMLFVTHHTEEILPCFDQMILLRDGEITKQGATKSLLNETVLSTFYQQPVQLVPLRNEAIAVYPY